MDYIEFTRKPFVVEAVEVTEENISEVSEFIGILKEFDDGRHYIEVDDRFQKMTPNMLRVLPGYWMTRMGNNIRCYPEHIFKSQFTPLTPEVKAWVDFLDEDSQEKQRL